MLELGTEVVSECVRPRARKGMQIANERASLEIREEMEKQTAVLSTLFLALSLSMTSA
tara:strand:+ start:742 stop:915 length:174 start_codon:yes stop_codon:yes gene_type:complete